VGAGDPRPLIWLLSAYRSASHAAWTDWLQRRMDHVRWEVLELPGRHFAWRIRGNPLSWIDRLPAGLPDRILATSMVDLATLKGLHPRLASIPTIYYFHENQFAYPVGPRQHQSPPGMPRGFLEPAMVQLYGGLAADRLVFNSAFNRDSFFQGIDELLSRLPDQVPTGIVDRLQTRSQVLPVPIRPIAPAREKDARLIVWNHRWEYDKCPDAFAEAMLALAGNGVDFRLALLGPRHEKNPPSALVRLTQALSERIVADGRVDSSRYRQILGRAGILVSTAIHEFQGLAVLEGASAGARPLVPDRMCYPEQYPPEYLYPAGNIDELVRRMRDWLESGLPPPADCSPWTEASLSGPWRDLLAGEGA